MTTPYDFVHLSLYAVGGKIRGKTKLQKTVYFLGVLSELIDHLEYRAHYYGPYSDEVSAAIARLISLGFVDQSVGGTGLVDGSGFEVTRHDYELNEQGKQIAELKAKQMSAIWKKIKTAAAALRDAGEIDYMKLSIAAKTHFMIKKQKRASMKELAEWAKKFGWTVKPQQVEEASQFLERLNLVEIQKA